MKKVLLSCVALAAGTAMAMAQALPEYPDKLDFTLNGQKELPGVTVTQEMVPFDGEDYLTVTITGESDADEITLDIAVPEGWDGLLTYSNYDGPSPDINPLKSKAPAKDDEDLWMPLEYAGWLNPDHTITLPADGEEWDASAYLVKGDQVYMVNIDFVFEVKKVGGNAEPVYPSALSFTLNGEKELKGVSVSQKMKSTSGIDYLTIEITGESNADEITIDFETPAGWDYALISSIIDGEDTPFMTRSGESDHWYPVNTVISMGNKKGNSFNFPVNGTDCYGTIYLVKGDKVWEYSIDIEFNVKKGSGSGDDENLPLIPESIGVTASVKGLTIDQEKDSEDGTIYLEVTGTISEAEYDLILDVPEGWDGFVILPYSENVTVEEKKSAKKISATDHDWGSLEEALEDGYIKGNKLTFKATEDWEYAFAFLYKGEQFDYNACVGIAAQVNQEESGDEAPAFPDHLDYTLNGEKELPGITVRQLLDETTQMIDIKGECNSDKITVTFETPEGWDGLMISDFFGYGEITTVKTRAVNDLIPISQIAGMDFKKGNTVTFDADGEANIGYIALIKGDMACQTFIDYSITVSKSEGGEDPGEDPVIPESYIVNTFDEGIAVTQGYNKWGGYDIIVEGEVFANEVPIVIDVPEGWDGFISYNWSNEGDVTITENNQSPRGTRAEEIEWVSVEKLLANGYEKGNRFTFEPTFMEAYNNYHTVEIHLYKGDMATVEEVISLEVRVSRAEGPVVPESFEVNVTPNGLNVTQGEVDGYYEINVAGESLEDEVEVTVEVPEGWDGFIGMTDSDFDEGDVEPLKKVQASEWESIENLFAWGFKLTNTLTFKVDGEEHSGVLYLYKAGLVDGANPIAIYTDVTKGSGSSVDSIDSAASARYYDLNGTEVAKPVSGIYVKKENGKTSKVVVK